LYYPRSFPKFIVLGFVLVCAPLVYALIELAMNLDLLAKQSEQAVVQAARVGQASRQVREQTTALERVVRQYLILDDPGLLDDYARVRQEFFHTTRALAGAAQDETTVNDINRLIVRESKLYQKLATPGRSAEAMTELADGYAALAEETQARAQHDDPGDRAGRRRIAADGARGSRELDVAGRRHLRNRAGSRADLRLPRCAPPSGRSTMRFARSAARISITRSSSTGRATCSTSDSGSNGCASVCTISKRSRTNSCGTCRMS
jgi:CHASE3 domain sensor protein